MATASSTADSKAISTPRAYTSFGVWRRLTLYLTRYKRWALIALVGIIGTNILAVIVPFILRDVIDVGIASNDSAFMFNAGLLVIGIGVLRGVTAFLGKFFGERLSHHIAYDIRNEVYDKVQTQSFTYQDNAQVGTIVTRAISDVGEIQRYFAFGLMDGLNFGFLFIGVSLVMFIAHPLLAFIAFSPLIPLAIYSNFFVMAIHPRWIKVMDRIQILSNHLQENALGAEVVRVFAREKYEIDKFKAQNAILYDEQLDFIKQWISYLPTSAFLAALSSAMVLFFGGLMEQQGTTGITVGLIVTFNAYVLLLAQPIRFIGFVILLTTQGVASAERVFEILDAPEIITSKPDAKSIEIEGNVKFDHVNFSYASSMSPVLTDLDFEAKPDQVVAIIGLTGAGKTSIINLIPRFYDVTSGRIVIDGLDVRDLDLHNLRSQIGMVLQQTLLFSATIEENIAYGRPEASHEEVIAAARAANAHDFISEFPEGYQTLVGERGVTLSGGQKQRVAIARALLINPRILILDDATSSVDTRTEFLIQQALERLMKGRTTFVIAQRMSTILKANLILVLKDGEIVQRGTHEDLLKQGGLYEEIYKLQLEEQERVRREAIIAGTIKITETEKRSTQEFRALIDRLAGK